MGLGAWPVMMQEELSGQGAAWWGWHRVGKTQLWLCTETCLKALAPLCQCRWNTNKCESKSRFNSLALLTGLGVCIHCLLMCGGTTGLRSQFVPLTFYSEGLKWSSTGWHSRFLCWNWEAKLHRLFQSAVLKGTFSGENITSDYLEALRESPRAI